MRMATDSTIDEQNVEAVKNGFAAWRFIAHDSRPFNIDALDDRQNDLKSKILGLKRIYDSIDRVSLQGLHQIESELIGKFAVDLFNSMARVQQLQLNGSRIGQEDANEIDRHFTRATSTIAPLLLARLAEERGRAQGEVDKMVAEVREFLDTSRKESENLILTIRNEISEAAIGKNSNFFHNESKRYLFQSIWWGIGGLVWMLSTLSIALVFSFNYEIVGRYLVGIRSYWPSVSDEAVLLQLGFSKVVTVGILTYAGTVIFRAFLSSLNLRVSNQQRAVSLDAYRFLLEGAKVEGERQSIVQRAAEAVFAIPETGLIRSSGSDGGGMNAVVNFPKVGADI